MSATDNKLGIAALRVLASGTLPWASVWDTAHDNLSDRLTRTATQTATQALALTPHWVGQLIVRTPDKQPFIGAATSLATSASWRKLQLATSAFTATSSGASLAGILKQGVHTLFIPASAMMPTASAPCGNVTQLGKLTYRTFSGSTEQRGQFQIGMPKSWNEGLIGWKFHWYATATGFTSVVGALKALALGDGENAGQAWGTAQSITDSLQGSTATQTKVLHSATGTGLTVGNSPAAGDLTTFQFYRSPTATADTYSGNMRLLGVSLLITLNAADDS